MVGMPVAEHPARMSGVIVPALVMRMAVDHGLCVVPSQHSLDSSGIDVHDRQRFDFLLGLALEAQRRDFPFAFDERAGQKVGTPCRRPHLGAKALVVGIIGAERVAVRQQRRLTVDIADDRVGKQGATGSRSESIANEKVTVAGHEPEFDAGIRQLAQCRDDAGIERIGKIVIACPVVEQVAKNRQVPGLTSRAGEEFEKQRHRSRFGRGQVYIGNE